MNTLKLDTSVKRERQTITTTEETIRGGTVTHIWVNGSEGQWIDISSKPVKSIFNKNGNTE